ncbi:MAG: radical SAM protein [Syntrophobacter sp.]
MRVLLINPPSTAPNPILPLGLAYLAAALEEARIEVDVIDAWVERYSQEALAEQIRRRAPDLVGVTVMSPTYGSAMRTVDTVRNNSTAKILVGGPHPSALPEQCLTDNEAIDFVITGEGEKPLVLLVSALQNGGDLSGISGLIYRDGSRIVNNGPGNAIEKLDDLPLPARHLFPVHKYKTHPPYGKKNPYTTLITSRGCPFHCTYCSKSVFGRKYRAMSPPRVVAEIRHIVDKYGIREIHFYDDDFTIDMKRAEKICDLLIEEGIDISWSCTTRVDLVNANLLDKMKRAGCWLISYGVETADPEILKGIRKGYTMENVKDAFRLTRNAGLRTIAFLMVGLPGETEETLRRTIGFSLALNPDFVSWGITASYPGSELYETGIKQGLGFRHVPHAGANGNGDGHASGSPYGDGYAVLYKGAFTRAELEKWVKGANRKFYLRPSYIAKRLLSLRSTHEFTHYMKEGWRSFCWMLDRG